MKKLFQSPLFHFLMLGLGIFLLYGWVNRDTNHPEGFDVHISQDHQIQIALAHQRNFGQFPDQGTMDKLIAAEIQSEIYYREALRLGLDEKDEIIRRRLKQKYEFLIKDNAVIEAPSEEALLSFYNEQKANYIKPGSYTFDHYYFNPDRRQDPIKDAKAFLLNTRLPTDPFHISSPKTNRTADDLRNEFGLNFAEEIAAIEEVGKLYHVSSGFGQHVIRLTEKQPSTTLPFDGIKDRLAEDYKTFLLIERNKQQYEELKKEYSVEIEPLN